MVEWLVGMLKLSGEVFIVISIYLGLKEAIRWIKKKRK